MTAAPATRRTPRPWTPGPAPSRGLTLIEMMVTLLIGAFLMIGVISIFTQSRTTFRTSDTVQRMQENVRFALNTLQPDIRLAGSWGMHSEAALMTVPGAVNVTCADGTDVSAWALDPTLGVEASNGANILPCPIFGNFQPGSDVLVVRHASGQPTAATNGIVQINSNRVLGSVFNDGAAPLPGACPPACTFDWQTQGYYISDSSSLGANVPSLRRQVLVNGVVQDQEVMPGVEDLQVQLGLDRTGDDGIDRFVDADAGEAIPGDPAYTANTKVLAVRLWLMFRSEQPEVGFVDGATYNYADIADYAPNDGFRRALVNKTVLLRNSRG